MKYLILLSTFFLCSSLFAQELPDTIIYIPLANGNFDVVEGRIIRNVATSTTAQIKENYASNRLNALFKLKEILVNIKEEIVADSISVADVIKDINPNDLYRSDLKEIVGDWVLDINNVIDSVTIKLNGTIKSNKLGNGNITVLVEGAKLILLTFNKSKFELRRKNKNLFVIKELNIKLYRNE